jgi:hypothetical protein
VRVWRLGQGVGVGPGPALRCPPRDHPSAPAPPCAPNSSPQPCAAQLQGLGVLAPMRSPSVGTGGRSHGGDGTELGGAFSYSDGGDSAAAREEAARLQVGGLPFPSPILRAHRRKAKPRGHPWEGREGSRRLFAPPC